MTAHVARPSLEKPPGIIIPVIIILVAMFGVVEVYISTPYGPGIGSDAVVYLTSAQDLLSGKGLGIIEPTGTFRLLPYFPPFYPLALSAIGLLTKDLAEGARWLNALLFGGLIAVMGLGFYRFVRNAVFAIFLCLVIALSSVLLDDALWAMSEPLSLVLGFGGFVVLLSFFQKRENYLLFLAAILVGLAFLTRYAGVAYCLAGAASLIFFSEGRIIGRMRAAILFGLVSILPMAIWVILDVALTGALGSRSNATGYVLRERISDLVMAAKVSFYNWTPYITEGSRVIHQPWFRIFLFIGGGILVVMTIASIRSLQKANKKNYFTDIGIPFIALQALFATFYTAMIAFTYLFTYPPISLTDRMLSPLLVSYLAGIAWLGALLVRAYPKNLVVKLGVALICVVYILNYGIFQYGHIAKTRLDGLGYNERIYRESALVAYAREIPVDVPIITNKAAMLYYFTGRPAYTVQEIFNPLEPEQFLSYGSDPNDKVQRVFREDGAALVLFNSIRYDFAGLYGREIGEARYNSFIDGLFKAFQTDDGLILYFHAPAQ